MSFSERKVLLGALASVFLLQYAWLFAMQRSCVVSTASGGGEAAKGLCEIATTRFEGVSNQAKDIFLALLVPMGAAGASAGVRALRKGKQELVEPEDGGPQR